MKASERIGQVLSVFTVDTPERSTSEIAQAIGLAPSSTHELLNGMAETGVLRKQAPGRFRLGPKLAALAQVFQNTDAIVAASQPIVSQTALVHGETVHSIELVGRQLAVLVGDSGRRPVRVARDLITAQTPLHCVAAGKLLLANLPAQMRDRMVDTLHLTEMTEATVTSRSRLKSQLEAIQSDGFCEALGEWHSDLATCAAPIRSSAEVPVAALSLAVPISRYRQQPRAYRNIALEAADRISHALGQTPSDDGALPIGEDP